MAGFMVFDNTTLSFQTYNPDDSDPGTHEFIPGGAGPVIVAIGDLQPHTPRSKEQIPVPNGFTLNDSKWFCTPNQSIPTIDDVGATRAATTVIDGRTYFVFRKTDYSNGDMFTDGFEYILILKKYQEGSGV